MVYKYSSHSTGKSEVERTSVINFIGRMVQQILPPRFIHYHLLVLDGLYTTGEDGSPIFTRVPGIKNDELACVVRGVSRRVIKYLRKTGRLSEDGEEVYIGDGDCEEHEALFHMKRASVSSRIALGARAGLKVRRIGSSFGFEEEIPKSQSYGCVSMNGFSIHAATSIKAHE